MRTATKPKAKKPAATVTISIPPKVQRACEYYGVTPQKYIDDVMEAALCVDEIDNVLSVLYQNKKSPGFIGGLYLVGEN